MNTKETEVLLALSGYRPLSKQYSNRCFYCYKDSQYSKQLIAKVCSKNYLFVCENHEYSLNSSWVSFDE